MTKWGQGLDGRDAAHPDLRLNGLSAIAELERSLIIERVKAGLRRAKLEGTHIGRRPVEVDRALIDLR